MKLFLGLLLSVALCTAYDGCNKDDDCTKAECCIEESNFWIVSKRDLPPPNLADIEFVSPFGNPKKGRCVKYMAEGASCHGMWPSDCGCVSGTTCVFYPPKPLKVLPDIGKRDFLPNSGDSFCEKKKD